MTVEQAAPRAKPSEGSTRLKFACWLIVVSAGPAGPVATAQADEPGPLCQQAIEQEEAGVGEDAAEVCASEDEAGEAAERHEREGGGSWQPRRVPAVTRGVAAHMAQRTMHRLPGWRRASLRTLDCRRGRINRTRWRCRVAWIRGGTCKVGRVQVYGARSRGRAPRYGAHASWRTGYGWIARGRVNCHFGWD